MIKIFNNFKTNAIIWKYNYFNKKIYIKTLKLNIYNPKNFNKK